MTMGDATWVVHSDGASRGNPGMAAIGCVVRDPAGAVCYRIGRAIGHTTNNQAEYRAALAGLEAALSLGAAEVELRMDSELIVQQLEGRYRVRNAALLPHFQALGALTRQFGRFSVRHVRRELNREADALANAALNGQPFEGEGDAVLVAPAASISSPGGSPRLKGSPKQVSWASRIRSEKLSAAEAILSQYSTQDVALRADVERALAALRAEASAKWWIESRNETAHELIEKQRCGRTGGQNG